MNEKVAAYLAKKAEEAKARRIKIMMQEGLYDEEPLAGRPEDFNADIHGYAVEHDQQGASTVRYFRKVPLTVSEEEWEQIAKYAGVDADKGTDAGNGVASMLKGLAVVVYLLAFIIGIVLGRNLMGEFSFGAALVYWVAGLFSGTMLLGFSEVVRLLHEINQKTR